MVALISPEYDLVAFCYRVLDKNPVEVAEAASAEITYAKRLHREVTAQSDFRRGSKGRRYCDQLQLLVSTLVNGTIPAAAPWTFRSDVRPLVCRLLERWEIGSLRREIKSSDG